MKMDKLLAIGLACMLLAIGFTNAVVGIEKDGLDDNPSSVEKSLSEGTLNGPIEIDDLDDLQNMRDNLEAHYVLVDDIDASGTVDWNNGSGFDPVGYDWDNRFTGSLDGQDHTITGLHINRTNQDYVGLFGFVGEGGEISNIGLEDVNISGDWLVGGLVGQNWRGTVSDSYAEGEVSGDVHVGGLVGRNDGTVENSYAEGEVSGDDRYVGGLVGENGVRGIVSNSYYKGNISGTQRIGGLVGENRDGGRVNNSYAIAEFEGDWNYGGIVGWNNGEVTSSFYHEDMPECDAEGFGSLPLSDDEFGSKSTFESAGWDIQMIDTDRDKPLLSWEEDETDSIWSIKETEQTYDLTINIEGEGNTEPSEGPNTYYEHGKIVITATPDEGNYFVNWTGDEKSDQSVITLTMDGDKSLTATFEGMDYEITNWEQLHNMRFDLQGEYTLMNDLNETTDYYDEYASESADDGNGWLPIGDEEDPFIGSLNGNGHVIGNMSIDRLHTNEVGLFGHIGVDGTVDNLNFEDARITGRSNTGVLVGTNDGMVSNVDVKGEVTGDWYIGGLVGNNRGTVSSSNAVGDVDGRDYVGGLVGINHGTVSTSHTIVEVSANNRAGGLVGGNPGTVSCSYSAGNVTTTDTGILGGLVGENNGIVENSHYNIDEVLINDGRHITIGGLFDEQYQDWIEDKDLDMDEYDSLELVDDHYEISDVQGLRDLLGFAWNSTYEFRLAEDIDLFGQPDLYIPYLGSDFDGNGFTISNLHINMPFAMHVGMFGHVIEGTSVSNVGILEMNVTGYGFVGGLVGRNRGAIENTYSTGNVSGEHQNIGGLVGDNWYGTVEKSYSIGDVSGADLYVGGLLGRNNYGTISNSYANCEVTGEMHVGGLIGDNWYGTVSKSYANGNVSGNYEIGGLMGRSRGPVSNSYATSKVTGEMYVGGLVGQNDYSTVTNSYATGNVSGDEFLGGLVGNNWDGTVENSFWDTETSGIEESDGGEGKTTEEMKEIQLFSNAEWDIVEVHDPDYRDTDHIWNIVDTETYPFFSWEESDLEEIYNWEDLYKVRENLTGKYILMDDLTPETDYYDDYASEIADEGAGWLPIGDDDEPFTGSFDSEGHIIYGLHINRTEEDYVGLFGHIEECEISNIGLVDVNITGREYVGGLVGYNQGTVKNSYATGDLNGENFIGGLVGSNSGTVENSYSTVDVTRVSGSEGEAFGGFVGYIDEGKIENCYSTGSVHYEDEDDPTDKGFAGDAEGNYEMTGNFWDEDTSGQTDTAGDATGKSTEEMMTKSTFTTEDWDFPDIWWIVEDETYPLLRWSPVYNVDSEIGFKAIQSSIDDPETTEGDTIVVSDGTFRETLWVTKSINLIGSGIDETYIDAEEGDFAVLITENHTKISGFTVINALEGPGSGIILLNPAGPLDQDGPPDTVPLVNCKVEGIKSQDNIQGIILLDVHESTIANSNISDNSFMGISMEDSTHNTLTENEMVNNGLVITGNSLEFWNTHEIDSSNTVNDSPVRYLKDETDVTVDTNAGQVILANCEGVTVEGMELNDGTVGITLGFSDDNYISDNTLSGNLAGIASFYSEGNQIIENEIDDNLVGMMLNNSDGNNIFNNRISNNDDGGIQVFNSNDNQIYLNAFIANDNQAFDNGDNDWDAGDPAEGGDGGNFWSDYYGDDRGDGIGDVPYEIDGDDNQDNYPWIEPFMTLRTPFFEVEITNYDEAVEEGETVKVYFTVENTGDLNDTQDIVFTVNGDEEDRKEDLFLDVNDDWSGNFTWEAGEPDDYDLEVASDDDSDSKIVTVRKDVVEYQLTINIEGEGTVKVDGMDVDEREEVDGREEVEDGWTNNYSDGTIVYLEATPDEDYFFAQWLGDHTGSDNETEVKMDRNRTITAVFTEEEPVYYTLTINIEGEGTVEVDGVEVEDGWTDNYPEGTTVNLEAIPDEDRFFAQWEGDHTGMDKETDVTMNRNREITALFTEEEPVYYTLTINIEGDGTVEVDGVEVEDGWTNDYLDGTTVALKAIPDEGWEFDEWQGTDETGKDITIEMTENKDITGIFIEEDDNGVPGFTLPLLVVAVVIAVVGGLIFFFMKNKPSGTPPSQPEEDIDQAPDEETEVYEDQEEESDFEEDLEEEGFPNEEDI